MDCINYFARKCKTKQTFKYIVNHYFQLEESHSSWPRDHEIRHHVITLLNHVSKTNVACSGLKKSNFKRRLGSIVLLNKSWNENFVELTCQKFQQTTINICRPIVVIDHHFYRWPQNLGRIRLHQTLDCIFSSFYT